SMAEECPAAGLAVADCGEGSTAAGALPWMATRNATTEITTNARSAFITASNPNDIMRRKAPLPSRIDCRKRNFTARLLVGAALLVRSLAGGPGRREPNLVQSIFAPQNGSRKAKLQLH